MIFRYTRGRNDKFYKKLEKLFKMINKEIDKLCKYENTKFPNSLKHYTELERLARLKDYIKDWYM